MIQTFHPGNFRLLCEGLGKKDKALAAILEQYSYPPMWTRPASFSTLVHIILEQQVSLASARAAFDKLKEKTGAITPAKMLQLSDEELRACYFSRQKTVYARHLATAITTRKLKLAGLASLQDDEIRMALKQVKGIGDWTADVYLLFALQRADIFPVGDLAMVNALKEIKKLPKNATRESILHFGERWRPHRSIATMLLWHYYIKTRNIKLTA
jgi:DNA-3-methyladenine glycosylase II